MILDPLAICVALPWPELLKQVVGLLVAGEPCAEGGGHGLSLAAERGIRVEETRTTGIDDYSNLISVTYRTKTQAGEMVTRSVAGSVFGEDSPHIVRIDGHPCDVAPKGRALVIWSKDVPGVLGSVGTALAAHGVNIASASYARETPGGVAITACMLDSDIAAETLDRLSELPAVQMVRYAHL